MKNMCLEILSHKLRSYSILDIKQALMELFENIREE